MLPSFSIGRRSSRLQSLGGDLAVSTTRPIYLVIASEHGTRLGARVTDKTREVAMLENDELMPFLLREAGRSSTVIELTQLAHDLQSCAGEDEAEQAREGQRMIGHHRIAHKLGN